jgi:hypothetical protein
MHFVFIYENRMKPFEIKLRGGEGMRKDDGGDKSNKDRL